MWQIKKISADPDRTKVDNYIYLTQLTPIAQIIQFNICNMGIGMAFYLRVIEGTAQLIKIGR